MCFIAIRENKTLAKISEFTVISKGYDKKQCTAVSILKYGYTNFTLMKLVSRLGAIGWHNQVEE